MLNELSDEEFEKEIVNISVYARVQPEHKVRIVKMWKEKGYQVDNSELQAFINDRTTNETLYMTSK